MKTLIRAAVVAGMCWLSPAAMAHEFTAHNIFLAYLKLIDPQNLAPYLTVFEARFAPKPAGNQTEFSKKITEADVEKILAKNLAAFDLGESFVVSTSANFGEYDFNKREFEFRPVTAATSFKSGVASWTEPGDVQVVFVNTKDFQGLPMDAASAEAFVKKNGRSVYIDVEFAPVSALEGSNKIRAKVIKVDVYADPRRTSLIHTIKAPDA